MKDIITGVFIQFENGMNTGDLVTIGPLTGTVERCRFAPWRTPDTGRITSFRGSITTFANFVRGIGRWWQIMMLIAMKMLISFNQALKDA